MSLRYASNALRRARITSQVSFKNKSSCPALAFASSHHCQQFQFSRYSSSSSSSSSTEQPQFPPKPPRKGYIRKTVYYSLLASGAIAFSAVFIIGGILIYDATTYADHQCERPYVSQLALAPDRGGPKNLKIASSLIDDHDDQVTSANEKKPRLVLIGGGWGSIAALSHLEPDDYNVVILSPVNYNLFTPLLPSACVGTVEIRSLVESLRRLTNRVRGHVLAVEAIDVVPDERLIEVHVPNSDAENFYVPYDVAVIACGSVSNTFGVPGLENAYQLKTVQDVLSIRKKIIQNLERAALPNISDEERKRLLSVVVCGGGPTGTEFASEVADLINEDVAQRFPKLLCSEAQVSIIQSRDHILNTYTEEISRYAEERFSRENINTILNARVQEITPDQVIYSVKDKSKGKDNITNPPTEHRVPAGLVLWSTGVGMSPFTRAVANHFPREQQHRHALVVDSHLRVKGAPPGSLYAIGDASTVETDLQNYLNELINEYDKDRDDKIDIEEFEGMVRGLSRKFPMAERHVQKAREIFKEWDANNDKTLDRAELSENFGKLSKRITSYPPTAQVASQEGKYLGKKLSKLAKERFYKHPEENHRTMVKLYDDDAICDPFVYKHLGSLAYIGNSAVFDINGSSFTGGLIAMYLWRSVYWSEQVSLRTRVSLMIDWIKRGLFGRDLSGFS